MSNILVYSSSTKIDSPAFNKIKTDKIIGKHFHGVNNYFLEAVILGWKSSQIVGNSPILAINAAAFLYHPLLPGLGYLQPHPQFSLVKLSEPEVNLQRGEHMIDPDFTFETPWLIPNSRPKVVLHHATSYRLISTSKSRSSIHPYFANQAFQIRLGRMETSSPTNQSALDSLTTHGRQPHFQQPIRTKRLHQS